MITLNGERATPKAVARENILEVLYNYLETYQEPRGCPLITEREMNIINEQITKQVEWIFRRLGKTGVVKIDLGEKDVLEEDDLL
jgi:hypothetical protein